MIRFVSMIIQKAYSSLFYDHFVEITNVLLEPNDIKHRVLLRHIMRETKKSVGNSNWCRWLLTWSILPQFYRFTLTGFLIGTVLGK